MNKILKMKILNETNSLQELYYLKLGSTPLFDSLFIYFNSVLALIALLSNAFSFFVFKQIRLNKKRDFNQSSLF